MTNGPNIDERLRAARDRREEQLKLFGMRASRGGAAHHARCELSFHFSSAHREQNRLEREQRARQYYEQQLRERKKKLLEHRLKEEKRRAAVEEKRRQRLKEEKVSSRKRLHFSRQADRLGLNNFDNLNEGTI